MCGSTNVCPPCAKARALENAEVLALDAMQGNAPTLLLVLTTPLTDAEDALGLARRSREKLMKALKLRWPAFEWACILEYSTGLGLNANGKRRPHWNYLVKGVPVDELHLVMEVVASVWCPRMGADLAAQHGQPVREAGGLMRYLALHFHKQDQTPPEGFKGHRFTKSRGYFTASMPVVREEARIALKVKRHTYRGEHEEGLQGAELFGYVEDCLDDDLARTWQLVREQPIPTEWDDDGRPSAWAPVDVPLGGGPAGGAGPARRKAAPKASRADNPPLLAGPSGNPPLYGVPSARR
jgi:hypothetical protein